MGAGLRIAFVIVVLLPVVILPGRPDLAPAWLGSGLGGVPLVIWLTIAWFAILSAATWLLLRTDRS